MQLLYRYGWYLSCVFFFFSSRRRHTRWPRDWSSDVCSSDLNFYKILEPKKPASSGQLSDHIEESLSHPVNDFSFSSIVKPGNVAGILVDPIVPLSAQMQAIEIVKARLNALGVSETKLFSRRRTSNVEA